MNDTDHVHDDRCLIDHRHSLTARSGARVVLPCSVNEWLINARRVLGSVGWLPAGVRCSCMAPTLPSHSEEERSGKNKSRRRWSETLGYQMLDEHGKPTSPVINYIGRPEPDVAPEAVGGEGHESD